MNISNRLARLIREGKPTVGMWMNLCDPGVAQIGAGAGYDWIMIDIEHNPLTESQVQGLLHALAGYDVQSIVRVRANSPEHIEWVLDSGAGGIMVPMMRSAADLRHSVEICKYHPLGMRGFGPNRASGYWTKGKEYVATANDDILLIPQIEHPGAVAEIDDIYCPLGNFAGYVRVAVMVHQQQHHHVKMPGIKLPGKGMLSRKNLVVCIDVVVAVEISVRIYGIQ